MSSNVPPYYWPGIELRDVVWNGAPFYATNAVTTSVSRSSLCEEELIRYMTRLRSPSTRIADLIFSDIEPEDL